MVFSSTIFLFFFLPVTLFAYLLVPGRFRNFILLFFSLLFYAWGETGYVFLMIASVVFNHYFAILIYSYASRPDKTGLKKTLLFTAIIFNLGLLCFFKYANFFADNLNLLLEGSGFKPATLSPVHLPIGISFFTFQALSYVIDVYRSEVKPQQRWVNSALYISLFPQLIAGPIVRYHDIANQLSERKLRLEQFMSGIHRFVIGLGKKVLIANTVGDIADQIFNIPAFNLTTPVAWIGIAAYTLQIYFDFSGYSDMAIGLGRMFGFKFPENFNYPYISKSIREFWRRWHISLSTWFRDYLYLPLGGSRVSFFRTYMNLLIVFFLCGLWHGASWNFVIWGLYHGLFLILERLKFLVFLKGLPRVIKHGYVIFIIMIGWVFFRAENISSAMSYLMALFGQAKGTGLEYSAAQYLKPDFCTAFIVGIIASAPVFPLMMKWYSRFEKRMRAGTSAVLCGNAMTIIEMAVIYSILFFSAAALASGTHNPFIYFRF